jgi:uncharacterized protein
MTKPSVVFNQKRQEIIDIAKRFPVFNIRLFGSVLDGSDTDKSDLDLLVDVLPRTTLFHLGGLQDELEEALGIRVDLLTEKDIPLTFRQDVIQKARPI